MRALLYLLIMGSLLAKKPNNNITKQPEQKIPFRLYYEDFHTYKAGDYKGEVIVSFVIDEMGKVINPEIIDTFDIKLNETIIDRVMAIKFSPAIQNGRPVRVRYRLPILFK